MTAPLTCPVCKGRIDVQIARSKAAKVSLHLHCPADARHFRGFINDWEFVARAIAASPRAREQSPDQDATP